eukprot:25268-Amphidinium_carterae.1
MAGLGVAFMLSSAVQQAMRYIQAHPASFTLGVPCQTGGADARAIIGPLVQPQDLGASEFSVLVARAMRRLFDVE